MDLFGLKLQGKMYGCNALYRNFTPDVLICVDSGMQNEVYSSGYAMEHKCYFRTWNNPLEENDEVHIIPENYSGWSAGPIAVRMALEDENPDVVYLIGFDLGSPNELINNVYKGTDNYLSDNALVTPSDNWITQHLNNFTDYPDTKFYKVNTAPLGTDATCQFVKEWEHCENLQYIEKNSLQLSLDFGWMM